MVLIVAADKMEFDGLNRRHAPEPLDWGLDYAAMTEAMVLVANGPGHQRAAKAVQSACDRENVSAIISTGFCGGLDPSLKVGDVVTANEVLDPESARTFLARNAQQAGPSAVGPVVSISRVAVTVEDKQELHRTGAIAVEMEAAAVAAEAQLRNIPFYCIRVVSDDANQSLPLDLNQYRTADGHFDIGRIMGAGLRSPIQLLPALRRFQKQCQAASESLGGYLAGCRF